MGAEENDNGGTGAGVRGDVRADRELETGQSTESDLTRGDLEQSTSPATSSAERIARHWYRNAELVYLGVDFGKCMEYDTLQVINRSVVRQND